MKSITKQLTEPKIDFLSIEDIIYWSKKWEISPYQLIVAFYATENNSVKTIEAHLRGKGFAL